MTAAAGYYLEDLAVGMEATFEKTVSNEDIAAFARVSGDHNPVHLDDAYAAKTMFKSRIAHGILTASHISAALAMRLPGPGAVYLSQSLRFRAPVRPGDTVATVVRVTGVDLAKKRAQLHCECRVGERVVLDGEAVIMVPSRG